MRAIGKVMFVLGAVWMVGDLLMWLHTPAGWPIGLPAMMVALIGAIAKR